MAARRGLRAPLYKLMRLTHIKLAGFKSFVDPTTIAVPGQLVGIVGPNGCGKSNVIDAVRWVLGETSAKQLRGGSMQDVIFAGSAERKSVGRASVELVFDNSLGRITGPWSQYAEVSVKRVVTRDGDSSYHINGQHVRRRDVTDIFLGTGLGPRAYSIIEQGMISRIIDAKPEELRMFLEEAAGVSKYRERRRETENRLEGTRENLARINDILTELTHNLTKLEGQAEVAAKYTALQAELSKTQQFLAYSKAREAGLARDRHAGDILKLQTQVEEQNAKLAECDRVLTTLRDSHYIDTDRLSELQGALYQANVDVGQLEQELTYLTDNRGRLARQIEALADEAARVAVQVSQNDADRVHWSTELDEAALKIEMAREAVLVVQSRVPEIEARAAQAQATIKAIETELNNAQGQQKLDQVKEGQALKTLAQLNERKNRLKSEMMSLPTPSEEELAEADLARESALEEAAQAEAEQESTEQSIAAAVIRRKSSQQEQQTVRSDIARAEAQLLALQQQQAKLESNNQVSLWAAKHGIDRSPKLWQGIKAAPGWEDAIEAALGMALNATQTAHVGELARDPPPGSFVAFAALQTPVHSTTPEGLTPLLSKVTILTPEVTGFLTDALALRYAVTVGDDIPALVNSLPAGAALVAANGNIYTRSGAHFYGATDGNRDLHGVLQRNSQIEQLRASLPQLHTLKQQVEHALGDAERVIQTGEEAMRRHRQTAARARDTAHQMEMQAARLRQNLQVAQTRRQAIKAELAHIEQEIQHEETEMRLAQEALAESSMGMDGIIERLDQADRDGKAQQQQVGIARTAVTHAERGVQEALFHERTCREKVASLGTLSATLNDRLKAVTESRSALALQMDGMHEGQVRDRLNAALQVKAEREKALAEGRRGMEDLTERLKATDEQRILVLQGIRPLEDKITELRFKEQEARINEDQFKLQLTESGADLEELAAQMEKKARSTSLQADIARLQEEIAALGAVNLAALLELTEARERKSLLDAQFADLSQAIETLENAIKRIDRETRELLMETFTAVNKTFGEMFPSLFQGGTAYLKLTGEEILDAGLQVFAQPPGKKNQTIQLLSGGEKALAALSLVFSLFRLNPAPFCILDEVDAPLDDSNTMRYTDLVKRMSDQTQFLFITHNKITMEMANQLVGVTMQEPGCSRIVEVDVDSAVQFARVEQAA
jgi:chromosome segregation protein